MYEYKIASNVNERIKTEKDVIFVLMKHSYESFIFSIRTAEFNYAVSKEIGFDENTSRTFFLCGLYHDVGKIGMDKRFIDYPGTYTEEMRKEMKKHTDGGGELLKKANADSKIIETAKYHHCNFDGSGYLEQLSGEEIPIQARITRISDSSDAFLSKRSYKSENTAELLIPDMKKYANTWYDPKILKGLEKVTNRVFHYATNSPNNIKQDEFMYFLKKIYKLNKEVENELFSKIRKNEINKSTF